mmetsp:Transcript_11854/g.30011  ORF Transcript_11854/g.30011 Transcript_11854/m.30011 type:complete len:326 (+) Transcript_11854:428-1405(+)
MDDRRGLLAGPADLIHRPIQPQRLLHHGLHVHVRFKVVRRGKPAVLRTQPVNFLKHLNLLCWVGSKQIDTHGECVGGCLVARQKKEEGVANDFVFGQRGPGLLVHGAGHVADEGRTVRQLQLPLWRQLLLLLPHTSRRRRSAVALAPASRHRIGVHRFKDVLHDSNCPRHLSLRLGGHPFGQEIDCGYGPWEEDSSKGVDVTTCEARPRRREEGVGGSDRVRLFFLDALKVNAEGRLADHVQGHVPDLVRNVHDRRRRSLRSASLPRRCILGGGEGGESRGQGLGSLAHARAEARHGLSPVEDAVEGASEPLPVGVLGAEQSALG